MGHKAGVAVEATTESWPMPVADFLRDAHLHLRRADVVLCRGSSLFSRAIRWVTRSQFSHAALVFAIPQPEDGFTNTFLIEAVPTGTDLTDLRHYVRDRSRKYDLVIKRFEAPWFDEFVMKRVRGHMLDFIKADYDFRTIWRLLVQYMRIAVFGLRARFRGFRRTVTAMATSRQHIPTHFICSGFVQYGFVASVRNLVGREFPGRPTLTAAELDSVVFTPHPHGHVPSDRDLIATTPEDLAASDRLRWLFVIRRGHVHRVNSRAEVDALLGQK